MRPDGAAKRWRLAVIVGVVVVLALGATLWRRSDARGVERDADRLEAELRQAMEQTAPEEAAAVRDAVQLGDYEPLDQLLPSEDQRTATIDEDVIIVTYEVQHGGATACLRARLPVAEPADGTVARC